MVRQLTAIMFTDMVGYTALMQEDERLAKEHRDRHREILERCIEAHGGRILQFYGDGTLSVFRSAIEAVRCAVTIQSELRASEPPVPVRIGVHTGDVVHDAGGVFGDGVNVAARIQSLSVPGGVLISGKVFDEVKNQADIRTRSLGPFNLKNVKRATQVYAVVNDGLAVPGDMELRDSRARERRSIAVLPFVNMSSDPENEFFSDGITEEVINALTRVNGLQVTARTSSFAFKNRNQDIRQIADELGVTHVLEGSVRRAGPRVRVTAQLICAADGYHLFSEIYDRSVEDIFAVQDEISAAIVEQLASHLAPVRASEDGGPKLVSGHSHDTEAYAEYLRGRFHWSKWTPDGARAAIRHYERSIEMDPDCALPYAGLATAHVFLGTLGQMKSHHAFPRAEEAAMKGVALEDDIGEPHLALAAVQLFYHWNWESAYRCFQKALTLAPGSAEAHQVYSAYLCTTGEFDEAIEQAEAAVRLDPLSLPANQQLAQALFGAGRLAEAEEIVLRILEIDPGFRAASESLGFVRIFQGRIEEAARIFERTPIQAGSRWAGAATRGFAYALLGRPEDTRRMLRLLEERQEEDPDVNLWGDFAIVHLGMGQYDQAIEYLRKAVEHRMGFVVFLRNSPLWSQNAIQDHPRFRELMDEVGAPTPQVA